MGRGTTYYTITTPVAKRISSHTASMTLLRSSERTTPNYAIKEIVEGVH